MSIEISKLSILIIVLGNILMSVTFWIHAENSRTEVGFYNCMEEINYFSVYDDRLDIFAQLYQLYFHCWNKIFDIINLKEERFILLHGFRSFIPCLAPSRVTEGHGWRKLPSPWLPGSRERRKRNGAKIYHSLVTSFSNQAPLPIGNQRHQPA